jgi:hypothetical protein
VPAAIGLALAGAGLLAAGVAIGLAVADLSGPPQPPAAARPEASGGPAAAADPREGRSASPTAAADGSTSPPSPPPPPPGRAAGATGGSIPDPAPGPVDPPVADGARRSPAAAAAPDRPPPDPPPPARPPSDPRPAGAAPARVFVHHSAADPEAARRAQAIARALDGSGFEVPALRTIPGGIDALRIRWFHAEDADEAARVRDEIRRAAGTGEPEMQDFTAYPSKPRRGTVEVWVSAR